MKDKLRSLADVGEQVRASRKRSPLSATEIAARAGRSRNVLNRLERGEDVSLSSLLALLAAMGQALAIVPAGRPTLDEMRERYAELEDDEVQGEGA